MLLTKRNSFIVRQGMPGLILKAITESVKLIYSRDMLNCFIYVLNWQTGYIVNDTKVCKYIHSYMIREYL